RRVKKAKAARITPERPLSQQHAAGGCYCAGRVGYRHPSLSGLKPLPAEAGGVTSISGVFIHAAAQFSCGRPGNPNPYVSARKSQAITRNSLYQIPPSFPRL